MQEGPWRGGVRAVETAGMRITGHAREALKRGWMQHQIIPHDINFVVDVQQLQRTAEARVVPEGDC